MRLQKMNLYDAMFTALVQDRADFVQLFLDNGVDLKRFLTIRRLRDLYDDVCVTASFFQYSLNSSLNCCCQLSLIEYGCNSG